MDSLAAILRPHAGDDDAEALDRAAEAVDRAAALARAAAPTWRMLSRPG